jgi:hypothetical protein
VKKKKKEKKQAKEFYLSGDHTTLCQPISINRIRLTSFTFNLHPQLEVEVVSILIIS